MKTNNSITFFEHLKASTEARWQHIERHEYSNAITNDTRWNPGLSDEQLQTFEAAMGLAFPAPLRNFYRTMNGLDRPYLQTNKDQHGVQQTHAHYAAYSYPKDLKTIRDMVNWAHESNHITPALLKTHGISRIFPIWAHRFMMIDEPGYPILSMYGNDIIFWAHTLAHAFEKDFLFATSQRERNEPDIRFWYSHKNKYRGTDKFRGWKQYPQMPKYRRTRAY